MSHRVFIYGTLKRGQPFHYLWTHDRDFTGDHPGGQAATFVGRAVTTERWPLVIATQDNMPFLLNCKGTGKAVYGEVYEMDDQRLAVMDMAERHPAYFERSPIQYKLICDAQDKQIPEHLQKVDTCWVYLFKNFKEDLLQNNFFEVYDSHGAHGLKVFGGNLQKYGPHEIPYDLWSKELRE